MTWKDRKVTDLKVGDIIQVRRDNARDKVRPLEIVSTGKVDGKVQLLLNSPGYIRGLGDKDTYRWEHDDRYIYFRWEE